MQNASKSHYTVNTLITVTCTKCCMHCLQPCSTHKPTGKRRLKALRKPQDDLLTTKLETSSYKASYYWPPFPRIYSPTTRKDPGGTSYTMRWGVTPLEKNKTTRAARCAPSSCRGTIHFGAAQALVVASRSAVCAMAQAATQISSTASLALRLRPITTEEQNVFADNLLCRLRALRLNGCRIRLQSSPKRLQGKSERQRYRADQVHHKKRSIQHDRDPSHPATPVSMMHTRSWAHNSKLEKERQTRELHTRQRDSRKKPFRIEKRVHDSIGCEEQYLVLLPKPRESLSEGDGRGERATTDLVRYFVS